MISMKNFDAENVCDSEVGARSDRVYKIAVVNNKDRRVVVADRNMGDQLAQNATVEGRVDADVFVVDVDAIVVVVAAVAGAVRAVSRRAQNQIEHKVRQRFVKMGHGVVVVVLDPLPR
jgi:hypothetical protein